MIGTELTEVRDPIELLVDTERYPLWDATDERVRALVADKRRELAEAGFFNLEGFLRPEALTICVAEVEPLMARASFRHAQRHNVYFTPEDPPLPAGHGALARATTSNLAVTGDQLSGTAIRRVYEWNPLRALLAEVFDKPNLYRMADPLACLNVMGYGVEDGIGWHFDRAEFTVTLLLQAPEAGGVFEYRRNLRTAEQPNYDRVARLLAGEDPEVRALAVLPGTLNVFAGYRSPHRVTPISGDRMRLIAVLSFTEQDEVRFSAEDRRQFYGRSDERAAEAGAGGAEG